MITYVLLKTNTQFRESGCYMDSVGDWWENRRSYLEWQNNKGFHVPFDGQDYTDPVPSYFIALPMVGDLVKMDRNTEVPSWVYSKLLTKDDAEYFV